VGSDDLLRVTAILGLALDNRQVVIGAAR